MKCKWVLGAVLITGVLGLASEEGRLPQADRWVYAHAFSGGSDPTMRVWGDGQNAVDPAGVWDSAAYAYGYLKFEVAEGERGAKLTVYSAPGLAAEDATESPLELRFVASDFDEEDMIPVERLPFPGAVIFEAPTRVTPLEDRVLQLEFEFTPEQWAAHFAEAEGAVAFALTSRRSSEEGAPIYRIYTKEAPQEAYRPCLHVAAAD